MGMEKKDEMGARATFGGFPSGDLVGLSVPDRRADDDIHATVKIYMFAMRYRSVLDHDHVHC